MFSNCMLLFHGAGSIKHRSCSKYFPTDPTVLYTQLMFRAILCGLIAIPRALTQLEVTQTKTVHGFLKFLDYLRVVFLTGSFPGMQIKKYFNKIHRIHTLLLHRLAENLYHHYLPRTLLPEKCAEARITFLWK